MYLVKFVRNGITKSRELYSFGELMDFIISLSTQGFETVIIADNKGKLLYFYDGNDFEEEEDCDSIMAESLGGNWW